MPFDKAAYQHDYMRKRRERERMINSEPFKELIRALEQDSEYQLMTPEAQEKAKQKVEDALLASIEEIDARLEQIEKEKMEQLDRELNEMFKSKLAEAQQLKKIYDYAKKGKQTAEAEARHAVTEKIQPQRKGDLR